MNGTRVLLVEDSRADARLLQELLSELPDRPFHVRAVGTLGDALAEVAAAAAPHVVLLDLSLPDAHGLEGVHSMMRAARNIPIVVLTGNGDERVGVEAVQLGAQDYLHKGEATPALLARTLRYAIERKKAEEDGRRLIAAEVAGRQAEEEAGRARFVTEVTTAVTSTLDEQEAARILACAVVPRLGDFCLVDLLRGQGSLARVAFACAAPEHQELVGEIAALVPGTSHPGSPVLQAVASGQSVLLADFDPTVIAPTERYRQICAQLEARAMLVTPLIARGRTVGAVTYVMGSSGRSFGNAELLAADDVASRVALALENARLYGQAQVAIRGRDELLAVVSHDLRNPLGVIALSLAMLEEEIVDQPAVAALRPARRAVRRMERLIEDLLDVAQIDAGTLRVDLRPVEMSSLLDDALEQHRALAEDKRIHLVCRYAAAVGQAMADQERLTQVLANLLGNALKFTPASGQVQLEAAVNAAWVEVSVSDTGPGIPDDKLQHVFDRFWQQEQRRDGVGLGLAIARGIVLAHGGTIRAENVPGFGARFTVALPRHVTQVLAEQSA